MVESPTASKPTKPACWSDERRSCSPSARSGVCEPLASCCRPSVRSVALLFVVEPSASCSAFTASSSASAHLSSSQSMPVTVAPACCAAVDDGLAPRSPSTPRTATTPTSSPASRPLDRERLQSPIASLSSPFAPREHVVLALDPVGLRSRRVSSRLSSVSTTPRSMTPAPITTPSASARKIATRDARVEPEVDHQPEKTVLQRDPEAAHEHVDGLGDDADDDIATSAAPTSNKMSRRRTRPS